MKRHEPTEDCDGVARWSPCVECGQRLCDCEMGYGHDCEEAELIERMVTIDDAVNTDENPHEPWPIEPLCCSFHYPQEDE